MKRLALLFAIVMGVLIALILSGCGSSERAEHVEEVQAWSFDGAVVDSPFGQFVVHESRGKVLREQTTDETTNKTLDLGPVAPIIVAAASGTPWGGIIAGIIGLVTAAGAGYKAVVAHRQRNELIAGVERAKPTLLPADWDVFKGELEKEQSRDTVAAVEARTSEA